jgi:subtilisin family serine protease
VVDAPPEQMSAITAAMAREESGILVVEPERVVYPFEGGGMIPTSITADYLRGYRDGVDGLVERALGEAGTGARTTSAAAAALNEASLTWGLQATGVARTCRTGRGIKVAVLDTGLDLQHPDFANRTIQSESFIAGQAVQDGHGHGTHCIGTACGPQQPGELPRYGVAYEAEIFAGKVLSDQGSGDDQGILAGIDWAIRNGCAIVSMSLGAPVFPGDSFSQVFETVAQRALGLGTLIIAAAGNESVRPGVIAPVGHPANCPSIVAVAAVDSALQIAPFSCGGINPQGGEVNIAGPGVKVRSTWPRPRLYHTISGTSMATPHVAGIAALWAEANPGARGEALRDLVLQAAQGMPLPARDVGVGLVQAP